jgi:chaperonin GroES
MNIRPLNDRILVKRMEGQQETSGGIIIPDTAKEKPQLGIIVAVGPGKTGKGGDRIPLGVEVGDRVFFAKYAGTEIEMGGEEHIFMKEDDILAVAG